MGEIRNNKYNKSNVGKYTRKGGNVKVSEAVKGQVKTEEVKGIRNVR